jgi:hypothetical protein
MSEDFADWLCNRTNEDYDYNMKKKALEKDTRINKQRFSSIDTAYKDWSDYKDSSTYMNTERATSKIEEINKKHEIVRCMN